MGDGNVKVAITGGSGFLAAHLIRHLIGGSTDLTNRIAEIRTIDRKPFRPTLFDQPSSNAIPLVHHCCDLLDSAKLEQALEGVDLVVHLARKSFDYLFTVAQKAQNERYSRDNLEATKALLNAMFKCCISRLVFVGDAYANIPPADNFGNSEDVHDGLPAKFLLGHYGESRAKAELLGREWNGNTLPNGRKFHALFLRPTFVYGEGDKKLPMALQSVARKYGCIFSDLAGPSNGMLQYIYAGNLAAIMAESMELLLSKDERRAEHFSGAFFYCMDETGSTKFSKFFGPLLRALQCPAGPSLPQWSTLLKYFVEQQLRCLFGWPSAQSADFSLSALQFLFGFAVGFTDRRMALILKHRADIARKGEWMERTAEWARRTVGGGGEAGEKRKGEEARSMG